MKCYNFQLIDVINFQLFELFSINFQFIYKIIHIYLFSWPFWFCVDISLDKYYKSKKLIKTKSFNTVRMMHNLAELFKLNLPFSFNIKFLEKSMALLFSHGLGETSGSLENVILNNIPFILTVILPKDFLQIGNTLTLGGTGSNDSDKSIECESSKSLEIALGDQIIDCLSTCVVT